MLDSSHLRDLRIVAGTILGLGALALFALALGLAETWILFFAMVVSVLAIATFPRREER